jgi:hypothetical protein
MQDFTFVEEQPTTHASGKINHDKMQVVGGLLREIHLFQHQVPLPSLSLSPPHRLANLRSRSK